MDNLYISIRQKCMLIYHAIRYFCIYSVLFHSKDIVLLELSSFIYNINVKIKKHMNYNRESQQPCTRSLTLLEILSISVSPTSVPPDGWPLAYRGLPGQGFFPWISGESR